MHNPERKKYAGPFSIDYRERGSRARGVYPTQGNSKGEATGRSRYKNNRERGRCGTRIMVIEKKGRNERRHERKKSQTRPN